MWGESSLLIGGTDWGAFPGGKPFALQRCHGRENDRLKSGRSERGKMVSDW